MGTNYYARISPCKTCGHSKEEIHIGKSSAGWTFSFHATDLIRSYKEWIKFLSKKEVNIYDEYSERVSLEDFKDLVESKKSEPNNHSIQYPEGNFLDSEGNSMSEGEFS